MLWVWGEPEGVRKGDWYVARALPFVVTEEILDPPRRGRPSKRMTGKELAAAHKVHLGKAAARTKKWREKKEGVAHDEGR